MVKKKTSRVNTKKNRKGATTSKKASTAADGDHGYEVSAYLRYLRNKPNLTSREKRLFPMYEYAEASDMSEIVLFKDEKSLAEATKDIESWDEADNLYFKDPRMWLFTIYDMLFSDDDHFDKLFKGRRRQKWQQQLQSRTEAMVKSAITSERIQGVPIEGYVLKFTVGYLMAMQRRKNDSADKVITAGSYLKLMLHFSNVAKDTKELSRAAGYTLCQVMVLGSMYMYKKTSWRGALVTVFRSGIFEEVLRNIAQPWNLEPNANEDEDMIRNFFRTLCCPTARMHKTFKRGSPLHNVLLDILQGRILPCKENMFVMDDLHALKRFIDIRYCKPTNAHIQNSAIDQFRRTCLKCKKVDHIKQMLVCARCKFVSYCCKECQVGDWKDHKKDCCLFEQALCMSDRKFTRNFLNKYQYLVMEKLKSASVDNGLETVELVIHLDFCGTVHAIAPALRDPPEFEINSIQCYLDQYDEKIFTDSMISKFGKNFVFVFLRFEDRDCPGAVQLQSDTFGEIWFFSDEMVD